MPVSTTSPSLPNEIKTLYERRLLTRALPRLVHGRFGQQAKWKGYGSYEVRRWESYSLVTTPLSEGTTPGENVAPTITVITITPVWYGAWVEYTDRLLLTVFSPALSDASTKFRSTPVSSGFSASSKSSSSEIRVLRPADSDLR